MLQGSEQGSAQERTRTAVTGALRTKLVDLGSSFGELRQRLHQDYRSAPILVLCLTLLGQAPAALASGLQVCLPLGPLGVVAHIVWAPPLASCASACIRTTGLPPFWSSCSCCQDNIAGGP